MAAGDGVRRGLAAAGSLGPPAGGGALSGVGVADAVTGVPCGGYQTLATVALGSLSGLGRLPSG